MRWYKLRASGLIYTVVKKDFFDSEYHCLIRFKNTVKPHPDWVRLALLRINAELIPEEKSKDPNVLFNPLQGWYFI